MKLIKTLTLGIAGALLANISTAYAQSPWLNNTQTNFVAFEFSKPNFAGGNDGVSFFTAAYDLSAGFAVSNKSEIIVDLPISIFSPSDDNIDSETTLGNIYLGLRTGDRSGPVRGEFGVLLPTASDEKSFANLVGVYSLPNREEKFVPDIWGLSAKVRAEDVLNKNGLFYRLIGGLTYANFSQDNVDFNFLYLDYLGQLGIRTDEGLTASLGISGRTALNDDSKYSEDDSSSFIFALAASYRSNNFEPGLTLNLPMDDPFKQAINNIVNVSLLFHLN